jgi:SAM-dependent methyltransferase
MVFLNPIPSWDLLSKYYSAMDKIEASRPTLAQIHRLRSSISLIRKGEVVVKGSRLLDVGCGDGSYMDQMRSKGLEVHGVEPDPIKARIAQNKSLRVSCGTLTELKDFEHCFHVITFNHVFEHVPNPHETLDKCRELMARGGILIIQVPRADSLLARIFAQDCSHFSVPFHLFNYSMKNMVTLLRLHGFETIRIRNIPDPSPFVYSFLLKTQGAEDQLRVGTRLLLMPVGLCFELFAMLFGKTATFEIWAKQQSSCD